jgi:hypothetical protein
LEGFNFGKFGEVLKDADDAVVEDDAGEVVDGGVGVVDATVVDFHLFLYFGV